MPEKEQSHPTQEAAEKLRRIEEFSTEPVPFLVGPFARHMADYVGSHHSIAPIGFIMAGILSIADMKSGTNFITSKPTDENLVGRSEKTYIFLQLTIPKLAKSVFPKPFADEVEQKFKDILEETKKRAGTPPEPEADSDAIKEEVASIDKAEELIIGDAKKRVIALDWPHIGITDKDKIKEIFDASFPLCLRNSGMNFPLSLLNTRNESEKQMLERIDNTHKRQLRDGSYLAMFTPSISSEEATFIRDWLWMKVPEVIIGLEELPVKRTLERLTASNRSVENAGIRAIVYMKKTGRA